MELALSFDSIASKYDSARSGYPGEIYPLASKVGHLGPQSRILEVGAGPGIATQELSEHVGCFIDVIEPGTSFCEILNSKFSTNPKISIPDSSFELFESPTRYDGIFSATAFHWIDPNVKYVKSAELLSKDGILVLYWNNYEFANPLINERAQVVYKKHFPDQDYSVSVYDTRERKIRNRHKEISESGYFESVESRVLRRIVPFSARTYIDLVKTFSENVVLDASISEPFFKDFLDWAEKNSPTVEVEIVTNLEIARRI